MSIRHYRDFVLIAKAEDRDSQGVATALSVEVFQSPAGEGERTETVTIPPGLALRALDLERRHLDVAGQMDLGETLAGLLLPPYARGMFSNSLAYLQPGEGLRLRLRLADEVVDFPWEFLFEQEAHGERTPSSFLALDPRISIVRDLALAFPPDAPRYARTRRLLVAMASPQPYTLYPPLVSLPLEQRALKSALGALPGLEALYLPDYGAGSVEAVAGVTLERLTEALALHEATDIFHFGGHGEFSQSMGAAFGSLSGEGSVILADAHNQAQPLSAGRLGELLRGQGVRLVVLSACNTGRRDNYHVWSSVVASLLKARIPAVVSMQFSVLDAAAAAFSEALYHALVAGFPLDYAVSVGRMAMRNAAGDPERDWGTPVLYLRGVDQGIFDSLIFPAVGDEAARQQAEGAVQEIERYYVTQNVQNLQGVVIGVIHGDIGNLSVGGGAPPVGTPAMRPESQVICPNCHTPNAAGSNFCGACGFPLPKS